MIHHTVEQIVPSRHGVVPAHRTEANIGFNWKSHRSVRAIVLVLVLLSFTKPVTGVTGPTQAQTQSGATKLQVTEDTSQRTNNTKKERSTGKATGRASSKFKLDVASSTDKIDAATGDSYIYVQFVNYAEFIGHDCVNGAPACENYTQFEFVEWYVKRLPPGYITVTPPVPYGDSPGNDQFALSPEGVGCFKVLASQGYVVMSGHPRYADIKKRLEDHYNTGAKTKSGSTYTAPTGEKFSTGAFNTGTSDADANGEEDLTETSSAEPTRDMIKDDPTGDHWGSLPDSGGIGGSAGSPWSHYFAIDWNMCAGNANATPTPGVGL